MQSSLRRRPVGAWGCVGPVHSPVIRMGAEREPYLVGNALQPAAN